MPGSLYNEAPSWPVEALQRELEPLLTGIAVEVLAAVDSTNSEMMRRIRQGQRAPLLLLAERQSAGRGRQGRTWLSHTDPDGQPLAQASLTFSLGLALQRGDLSGLSLAVGLALAEALHPDIGLKWPNDLVIDDLKVAGVLAELDLTDADAPAVVVGIGINLTWPGPPGVGGTCLLDATGVRVERDDILELLLNELAVRVALLGDAAGRAGLLGELERRLVTVGREVRVVLADAELVGTAIGLNGDGHLRVETADGVIEVAAGDVIHLRPA